MLLLVKSDFQIVVCLTLLMWNVMVFGLYGYDKRQALYHRWRVSERTLLFSSLLFGGLGAAFGGYCFHHKTRKWYFKACWLLGLLVLGLGVYTICALPAL
ncbi:DUF1294 domain-containing protein [Streptococcus halichoeri]|uniref:DUF1294 domain-containing protein n=1 Tax=Streptococcus halichoeri TaxID=254785 RepID=UPI001C8D05EE|nr:DUF1294 domain-containing protein [Streptococcus halichoeri]